MKVVSEIEIDIDKIAYSISEKEMRRLCDLYGNFFELFSTEDILNNMDIDDIIAYLKDCEYKTIKEK